MMIITIELVVRNVRDEIEDEPDEMSPVSSLKR
jgi:hypothetical protein